MISYTFTNRKNLNIISQSSYSADISNIDFSTIKCSNCLSVGLFVVHAYYCRYVKLPYGKIKLRILRIRCSECGITHALIPIEIIPYTQRSLETAHSICLHLMNKLSSDFIDPDEINHIKYSLWKSRLDSFDFSVSLISIICFSFDNFKSNLTQLRFHLNDSFIIF